jgi:2-polyprenyl-3-methyl-5-hydroxy-6-metoxy-1,4-benzoquinol methylase
VTRTERGRCAFCGSTGDEVYSGLQDRLFGAPGRWSVRRCEDHDLWFVDPRPTGPDLASTYASYYTHETVGARVPLRRTLWNLAVSEVAANRFGYAPSRRGKEFGSRALVRKFVEILVRVPTLRDVGAAFVMWLPGTRPGKLLDVGAGDGRFLKRMRDAGWDVLGLDTDEVAADLARNRFGVEVRTDPLHTLVELGRKFDAVTMSHVIEHVGDPVATLGECWELVAPGGRLVVLTPNVRSEGHRVFGDDWRGLEPPRHLFIFSIASLRACAEAANVPLTVLRTTARGAAYIGAASSRLRRPGPGFVSAVMKAGWAARLAIVEGLTPHRGEELLLIAERPR